MRQGNSNCYRHPQNTISHVCTLSMCHFRFLCQQCIEEKLTHEHLAIDKEQLLVKLENQINHWKHQKSLDAQFSQNNRNIRHFKRVIDKLCEQIKKLNESTMEQENNILHNYKINEMEQELQKLRTGNLSDLHYHKLIFSENKDELQMENFSKYKAKIQIINQNLDQANKILDQILNNNNVAQQQIEINEDIFYQNCQKMRSDDDYYAIKEYFQNDTLDIDQQIRCLISTNCDQDQDSQIETEEQIKNIVTSIYILCKEMEYDLEVNDLFEIISTISNPGTATNIIEDILDYK